MHKFVKYLFFILNSLTVHCSLAAASENNPLKLNRLQGGISYLQTTDGNSEGIVFDYTPRYYINSEFSAGLNLGVQNAKYRSGQTLTAFEYLAAGDYRFNDAWQISLLLGAQSWTNSGSGTYASRGAQLTCQLPSPVFGYYLSVWGQYLTVDYTPAVQIISTGIALQF